MAFDKDGKGSLGIKELQHALNRLGVMATRPQIKKLIDFIDLDGSGRVEYSEFQTVLVNQKKKNELEKRNRARKKGAKGRLSRPQSGSTVRSGSSRPSNAKANTAAATGTMPGKYFFNNS